MSSFQLKILAIVSMLIDHMGFLFFPQKINLRLIGRLAFPIFAFQLAVGYSHSKNKEKHIFQMLIFAIVSQIPYLLFYTASAPNSGHMLNIGFTLTLGLLGMYVFENIKHPILKILGMFFVLLLSCFLPVDYGWFGVSLSVLFYILRSYKILSILAALALMYSAIVMKQNFLMIPMVLALIPIWYYNGKKGKSMKYFFYICYPLHLLVYTLIYKLF